MFDLSQLQPEHFDHLVGSRIAIVDSEFTFTVKTVDRLKSPSPRTAPFALTLSASTGVQGRQGIYRLLHPQLGELAIFLVPVASSDEFALFEAVFN